MKTLSELLQQYEVSMDYSCAVSNLVYPMDNFKSKYVFKGYAQEEDVEFFLNRVSTVLNSKHSSKRIGNKYAIPFMQVGLIHRLDTYFYYQHDKKTWVLVLTEETKEFIAD